MSEKSTPQAIGTLWRTPNRCSENSLRGTGTDPEKRKAGGHQVNLQDQVKGELLRGSSPAVFPASHSVVPGSERASRMTVSSGLKCSALCRNSGPVGCLVRTLLESSVWRSTIVLLRWKPSATPHGRLLFRLAPSTPRTDATGCGLWPTPHSFDSLNTPIKGKEETFQNKHALKLSNAVNLWLTPKGEPSGPDFARANREGSGGDDLATRVAKMPPTAKGREWKGQTQRGIHAQGDALPNQDRGDGKPIGGQLNPTWVEWLMGYPPGWTDLSASETP